jgi:RNA polymerase primary sigma factor
MERVAIAQPVLLSLEEEHALILDLRSSEDESTAARMARERIVLAHRPLVLSIAGKAFRAHRDYVEFEDLVSAGFEGLCEALDRFDCSSGVRFCSYARWWVFNRISRLVRQQRWPMQIPDNVYREIPGFLTEVNRYARRTGQSTGRPAAPGHIAANLGITVDHYHVLLKWLDQDMISLSTPVGEDGQSTLESFIPGNVPMPDAQLFGGYAVDRVLGALSREETMVIWMRFGLDGEPPLTQEEVGVRLRWPPRRVGRTEKTAFRRLRAMFQKERTGPASDEDTSTYVQRMRLKLAETREYFNHADVLNPESLPGHIGYLGSVDSEQVGWNMTEAATSNQRPLSVRGQDGKR